MQLYFGYPLVAEQLVRRIREEAHIIETPDYTIN